MSILLSKAKIDEIITVTTLELKKDKYCEICCCSVKTLNHHNKTIKHRENLMDYKIQEIIIKDIIDIS